MSSPSSPPSPATAAARAHWTIYLPSILVALVWAGIYGWAVRHQPVLAGVRGAALVVEALGVPLLLFFAAVRARVLLVEVRRSDGGEGEAMLYARSGFLRPREVHIGAREIASARVRRSLPQRLFGGGALDLKTLSGESLFFTDLDKPEAIAQAMVRPVRETFGHMENLR
ncbi:MAG TPA: PH domain-containing protein [Parvibaculum sp.]|jgi:hypothetical protein